MKGDSALLHDRLLISHEDRGFRFGDGIFTTIAIIESTPLLWNLHLARLQKGIRLLQLPCDLHALAAQLKKLITLNHVCDGVARIFITRGCGSQGYLPTYETPPTIMIEATPYPPLLANLYHDPLAPPPPLTLHTSTWRRPPPCVLPNSTKLMQGLNPILAKLEAREAGAQDALMLDMEGNVSEASSGNLFWLDAQGALHTPPLRTGCLAGVMRSHLMTHFPCQETLISEENLLLARAVYFSNATTGIRPIEQLNGHLLALDDLWLQACQKYLHTHITHEIPHVNNVSY